MNEENRQSPQRQAAIEEMLPRLSKARGKPAEELREQFKCVSCMNATWLRDQSQIMCICKALNMSIWTGADPKKCHEIQSCTDYISAAAEQADSLQASSD